MNELLKQGPKPANPLKLFDDAVQKCIKDAKARGEDPSEFEKMRGVPGIVQLFKLEPGKGTERIVNG